MKRLLATFMISSFMLVVACSDDDGDKPNNPGLTGPPRPVAVVKTTEPAPSKASDTVWDSVVPVSVDLERLGPVKAPGGKAAVVANEVDVQAIIYGTKLYLRFEWDDDSLNIMKDVWILNDPEAFTFERNPGSQEDQLLVLFAGLPNDNYDVWHWRTLTTGTANLAEGYNFNGTSYTRDAGAQIVVDENESDPSRPEWVHQDGSSYTGSVLYTTERTEAINFVGPPLWPLGHLVPGWCIDSVVGTRVQEPAYRQSRWDTRAVSSYDAETERYALVLWREMNTTYTDDLNLAPMDSVQIKVILIDNQAEPMANNNSNQSSSDLFWLILQ